ncbi:MAG: protein tyrosine phosphatase, partial [Bradyrhizobium sp.]
MTLINPGTLVVRPDRIAADRHLFIGVGDIVEALPGHVLPAEAHVRKLIRF